MAVTPFKSSDNFNMAGFNEKITEADNTYVAKTGDSMSGVLSMGNNKITNVASPISAGDAATKEYVDELAPYDYLSEFGIPKEMDIYWGESIYGIHATGTIKNYLGYCIVSLNVTSENASIFMAFYKDSSFTNKVNPQISSVSVSLDCGIGNIILQVRKEYKEIGLGKAEVGTYKCVLPFNCY